MPKLSIRRRVSAVVPNVAARETGGATCVGTLAGRSEPNGSDASVITGPQVSGKVRQSLRLQSIAWVCGCHLAGDCPVTAVFRSGGLVAYLRSPWNGRNRAD